MLDGWMESKILAVLQLAALTLHSLCVALRARVCGCRVPCAEPLSE